MIGFTPEQREAIGEAIDKEGYAWIDGYVVLKAESYDRIQALLDDGPDMRQIAALVEEVMRDEDAGDPLLESYQRYRP